MGKRDRKIAAADNGDDDDDTFQNAREMIRSRKDVCFLAYFCFALMFRDLLELVGTDIATYALFMHPHESRAKEFR